jgi:hypothetical protein
MRPRASAGQSSSAVAVNGQYCANTNFSIPLTCSIAVQSSHGDSKQGTDSEELVICLAETSTKFEDNEEEVVHNERPFTSVAISSDTEGNRPYRTEHQH